MKLSQTILNTLKSVSHIPNRRIIKAERFTGRPNPDRPSLLQLREAYTLRGGITVVYAKKLKRVTLQRYICSNIALHPERVSYNDLLVLFDNMLWLQDKCLLDPLFKQKFGKTLEVLALRLKEIRIDRGFDITIIRRISNSFLRDLKGFLFEERHLIQARKHVIGLVQLIARKQEGTPTKQLPPIGYIGKGYRDKGTARKPWLDGNPSWQEIASSPIQMIEEIPLDDFHNEDFDGENVSGKEKHEVTGNLLG